MYCVRSVNWGLLIINARRLLLSSQSGTDYPPLSSSPLQLTPSLVESQIQRIANTAEDLIKAMSPTVEAKSLKNNKKVSKEVEVSNQPYVVLFWNGYFILLYFWNGTFFSQMVLAMEDENPRKLEEIRRFSAIYGRFDCKRKPEKPLTLHEVRDLARFSNCITAMPNAFH